MESIIVTLFFVSLLSIIVLLFISRILNNNPSLVKKNYRFFLLCLTIIGVRLMFPFDLPMVHIIPITTVLPQIYLFLYKPFTFFYDIPISIFNILTAIWLFGTFICILRLIYSYYHIGKVIHGLTPFKSIKHDDLLEKIVSRYKKPVHFHLVTTDKISSPVIFGIRNPHIVIPPMNLSDEDWTYILSHEVAHFYQKDMYLKLLFEIYHAIYWWNPLYYLIKKQLSILLEIKIDAEVCKELDEEKKLSYLECLLKVAKKRNDDTDTKFVFAFNADQPSEISKRIHVMITNTSHKSKSFSLTNYGVIIILTLCTLILPTFYTLAPSHIPSDVAEETFTITKENAYFIRLNDDTYDLYVDGIFMKNIPSPKILGVDINIYSNIKEVPKND